MILVRNSKEAPGNPRVVSSVACLRVNKWDHDVPRSFTNRQTLMVVCKSPWMHQHPAEPSVCNAAVVADEPASTSLIVYFWSIESHVDGVCGGVMVWSQRWLLIWSVAHHKVHNRSRGVMEVSCEHQLLQWPYVQTQHLQPVSLQSNLLHVDITGRHVLIATIKT